MTDGLTPENAKVFAELMVKPWGDAHFRTISDHNMNAFMNAVRREERERAIAAMKAEAYRYARCYQPGTDSFNTFTMLGDAVERVITQAQGADQ